MLPCMTITEIVCVCQLFFLICMKVSLQAISNSHLLNSAHITPELFHESNLVQARFEIISFPTVLLEMQNIVGASLSQQLL